MATERIVVVGSGAFGMSAGRELAHRGYEIVMVDPTGPTPHSQASSRDISKVVRSEYDDDTDYTALAAESIDRWIALNEEWDTVYHNVGVTLLTAAMTPDSYEGRSLVTAQAAGNPVEILDEQAIRDRFPMFQRGRFKAGYHNSRGGFVEALRVLWHLRDDLNRLGVHWHMGQSVVELLISQDVCHGVILQDGSRIAADHVLLAAGAWTGILVPELQGLTKPIAQPIFHLGVQDLERYSPPQFTVIFAEMARTGHYLLPVHPRERVVKIGLHTSGRDIDPLRSDRLVNAREVQLLRSFLSDCIPELAVAPIVDSRICLYHDTLDYHFWIDHHPAIRNLTVACGGSGHAFKFTPVLGEIIADKVENLEHPYGHKFCWRSHADITSFHSGERLQLEDL